jgi:hypothetical protein
VFFEVFPDTFLILFVAGMTVLDIPAIDQQGEVGQPGHHIDPVETSLDSADSCCPHLHAMGDVQGFYPFFEGQHLHQEVEFLVGLGRFLCPVEQTQALLEQPFL